jgi:hypothetical protein
MESIILNIVQGYLKDYVNNFRKEQVSLNFLRGQGSLRDLDINVDAINDLVFAGSPGLRFTRILCNSLAIRSPDVWSLKNKPITFFIDRLFVEIAETVDIAKKPRPPPAPATAAKKTPSAKYGFIDRVIDCLSFEVNQVTVAFRTIGRVKTTAVGCWTPPVLVIELGAARLFCTNHNGVETELNECIRVRNTRRPLLFLYKHLNIERASVYMVNPEVWDDVADELITGLSGGGILGLNSSLDKGSRGYVSMRIVHNIPLKVELCMRKRMDNNLLLGLEIAVVVDTVKLTIKPQQLSELVHFLLGMNYCLFRLDAVEEIYGPDPHGEGFSAGSAPQSQKGGGGATQSPVPVSGSGSGSANGSGRRNQFGREDLANLDRLDAEINTSGSTAADLEGDERVDDWQRSSLNSDEDPPHMRSVMVIQVNEVVLSLPLGDETATSSCNRSSNHDSSNNNSNDNSKNNHNSNNTRNSSNSHHTHPPTRHPSVALARLTGLVHTTIWPEHAGLTESIGQMTLKSFRLSEQRGVRKVCLLWSKEPLDVGGRPIFITPLPRGVKEQSVCDLETLPGTSFVW